MCFLEAFSIKSWSFFGNNYLEGLNRRANEIERGSLQLREFQSVKNPFKFFEISYSCFV